jgi:hypothetical protein
MRAKNDVWVMSADIQRSAPAQQLARVEVDARQAARLGTVLVCRIFHDVLIQADSQADSPPEKTHCS